MRWILAAALAVAAAAATPFAFAGDDLTPELKKEQAKIESQIASLEDRVARLDREAIEQGVREVRQWIKEFAIDAELPDSDKGIAKWKTRLDSLLTKAASVEKDKMAAEAAAAAERAKSMTETRDYAKEIKGMVKVKVDMNNISFKKDVAPILQNVCVRCHSTARKGGEFDASTYESVVAQVTPGNPEDSHMLKLVTGKAQPRMPRGGQARFDREWADIWTAWIKQGAKFDGPSKTAQISTYLIDLDVQRRAAIAGLSESDLLKLHKASAERHMVMTNPSKPVHRYETPNFLVFTTLPESEAEYIGVLAEALLEDMHPKFGGKERQAFRGKLGLNVFADRVDYVAFARLVDKYAPENYEFGHGRNTPEYSYVALTTEHPNGSLDGLVSQQVAGAYLRQLNGGKLPPWAIHGYSTVEGRHMAPKDPLYAGELAASAQLVMGGKGVAQLAGENLPWGELAPLSSGFFQFLASTNQKKTADFLRQYAQSGNWQAAAAAAFGASPAELQRGFAAWSVSKGGKR